MKLHSSKKINIVKSVLVLVLPLLISACVQTPSRQNGGSATAVSSKQKSALMADNLRVDLSKRHEKTLANGLKIIIKEDHRAPVVMTQVWYKVGSTDEPKGKGGISHLLEHMMFKGTNKVSGDDFNRIVSRYGGQQNAFTSHDYTGYYQYYPALRLPLALELEADRMQNLQLQEKDFLAERQVVMEERRQRTDDNPRAKAYEQFRYKAFSSAAQRNPVIGSMTDIENISLDDLKQWYKQWYAPNNATLVIVGDVQPERAFAAAEKYFGGLKKQTTPERVSVREPQLQGLRSKAMNLALPVPTLYMAYNVPSLTTSIAKNNKDAYALALLADVLDGGLSARLESKLVREKKILASVSTSYDLFSRGDGLFFISATPSKGVSLAQAKKALVAEINALKNQPITQKEIHRSKTNYVTGILYQQDSISAQARMIGLLATIGLNDTLIGTLPEEIGKISEQRLHDVAKKYFVEANLTVFNVLPEVTEVRANKDKK